MQVRDVDGTIRFIYPKTHEHVFVEVLEPRGHASGLLVVRQESTPRTEGVVVEVPYRLFTDAPLPVKVGDHVIFARHATGTDDELVYHHYDWETWLVENEDGTEVAQEQFVRKSIYALHVDDIAAVIEEDGVASNL